MVIEELINLLFAFWRLDVAKRQINFFGGVLCVVLPLCFSFVALVVFVLLVVFPACVPSAPARRFAPCPVVGCRLRSPSSALCSLSSSVVRSVGLLVAPSFVSLARSALRLVLRSCFVALGSPFVLLRVGCPSCRRFSSFGCRVVRLGVGFSHTLISPIDKLRLLIYNLSVPDGVVKHINYPRHGLRATDRAKELNSSLAFLFVTKAIVIFNCTPTIRLRLIVGVFVVP